MICQVDRVSGSCGSWIGWFEGGHGRVMEVLIGSLAAASSRFAG